VATMQAELRVLRAEVERLRAEQDARSQDDGKLERAIEALRAENERLRAHIDAIELWASAGERLVEREHARSGLFGLGAWWSDRPWRSRGAGTVTGEGT